MKKIKLPKNINPFWSIYRDDYHEFDSVKQSFKEAGLTIKYEEVGCAGNYEAVCWLNKKPTFYIKERKAHYNKYDAI